MVLALSQVVSYRISEASTDVDVGCWYSCLSGAGRPEPVCCFDAFLCEAIVGRKKIRKIRKSHVGREYERSNVYPPQN